MPSRNVIKEWAADEVYHVYNRGNNKQQIFRDAEDYAVFMNLLKRSLGEKIAKDRSGRLVRNWHTRVELLAFCLMPNHFHLLLYQNDEKSISDLIRGIANSYTGYFNKKYDQTGHLFQGTFKASRITEEDYWQHISRYIHLNPANWREWPWSSLDYYLGEKHADWVKPDKVLGLFEHDKYIDFVSDYETHLAMLDELKYIAADGSFARFDLAKLP